MVDRKLSQASVWYISYSVFIFLCQLTFDILCTDLITLTCEKTMAVHSDNYPETYPSGEQEWNITAPLGRRIQVTFNDFALGERDTLLLLDMCSPFEDHSYTGHDKLFPPFLSLGNRMCVVFHSPRYSRKRRGFNLSISCHVKQGALVRLVNDKLPQEGLVELLSEDGKWTRVCEDGLSRRTAKLMCRELGYPDVHRISYVNGFCSSSEINENCATAPQCDEYSKQIRDCSTVNSNCTTRKDVQINCFEPGYLGCYDFKDESLPKGFYVESLSTCLSSCRSSNNLHGTAVLKNGQCFCSTTDPEGQMHLPHNDNNTHCTRHGEDGEQSSSSSSSWGLVYSASMSFCETLTEVENGAWDSNDTWFGSIVHLNCSDGYILNGSDTLQCVPGRFPYDPYYPVWSHTLPTCVKYDELVPPREKPARLIWQYICICIFCLVLIPVIYIVVRWYIIKRKRECFPGAKNSQALSDVNTTPTRILEVCHDVIVLYTNCMNKI